ncbi:hypothetical protein [Agarilytica rhodophyticola]|uniref:hypothetical protein n=1 Tax=Agarilytica rhodophyticola TaxID=1737490 RepID=UPI000B3436F3|nr:hypothetical protein [Agarilytica rhodophyticola]
MIKVFGKDQMTYYEKLRLRRFCSELGEISKKHGVVITLSEYEATIEVVPMDNRMLKNIQYYIEYSCRGLIPKNWRWSFINSDS